MSTLMIILGIAGLAAAVLLQDTKKKGRTRTRSIPAETPPYFKKPSLLHEQEQGLYFFLRDAMPEHYVMAQVRLADIVDIKDCENWRTWFNKISSKSVDFVLCDKSFAVLACVEYDGWRHRLAEQKKRDEDKDDALRIAGIPIVRIPAGDFPSVEYFHILLEQAARTRRP